MLNWIFCWMANMWIVIWYNFVYYLDKATQVNYWSNPVLEITVKTWIVDDTAIQNDSFNQ